MTKNKRNRRKNPIKFTKDEIAWIKKGYITKQSLRQVKIKGAQDRKMDRTIKEKNYQPILPLTKQEKRNFLLSLGGVAIAFIIICIIAIIMSE